MIRLFFGLCLSSGLLVLAAPPPSDIGLDPDLPSLFIAGDSTAAPNGSADIQGWAEPFQAFFDPARVNVANRARGGRSSRTFITEGHWAKLLAELKRGDVVLIQFGHNDGGAINREPPESDRPLRARGSLPGLGAETEAIENAVTGKPEVVRTFGSYLREMITDVETRGATPILLSLTVRDRWSADKVERNSGSYREWTRNLAQEKHLGFVDLTRLIGDAYQELGEAAAKTFFTADYVHTNEEGARLNAALVLSGLKGLRRGGASLDDWLSAMGQGVPTDSIGWLQLPEPSDPELPSVVLIGDSTVRNGGGDGSNGEWGWGEPLAEILDPARVNVVNRAIGGLSSRTFLTQGHWSRAQSLIKPGDVVLIQFGHNDSAPLSDGSRARGTIRTAGPEQQAVYNLVTHETEVVHAYGDYLRTYIREARARGAHPVVCTPVPRKRWVDGTDKVVRGGDYAKIATLIATEQGVPLFDLNRLVADRYDQLDRAAVDLMFADAHTHTSRAGAELTAEIVKARLHQEFGAMFD